MQPRSTKNLEATHLLLARGSRPDGCGGRRPLHGQRQLRVPGSS